MNNKIKTTNLEIVELKIVLHTNKDSVIDLTTNLFVFDKKTLNGNKNPYLCTNLRYSKDLLNNKTLFERVETFFNRKKFNDFLLASKLKKSQEIKNQKNDNTKNQIIKENILIMLKAIFPISFPIKDEVINMHEKNIDIFELIKQIFKTSEYVYLNIDKPSTVIQVIWLNTISTNPIYYQLNKTISKYYQELFDYLQENIKNKEIQDVVPKNFESFNNAAITNIKQKVFELYENDKKNEKPNREIWNLYFLFAKLKKNTLEYNNFISTYIKKFISMNSNQYYREDITSANEKKFFDSIEELKFHFEYMEKIIDFLPPKRISTTKDIFESFGKNDDLNKFTEIFETNEKMYAGVDKVNNGKLYEIHIGISVVGGKVTETNYKFLCNYNSHRLGNELNYLIKDTTYDTDRVRLYSYINLENVNDANDYSGVVNTSIKKNDRMPNDKIPNNRMQIPNDRMFNGGKTRKRGHRNKKTRRLI